MAIKRTSGRSCGHRCESGEIIIKKKITHEELAQGQTLFVMVCVCGGSYAYDREVCGWWWWCVGVWASGERHWHFWTILLSAKTHSLVFVDVWSVRHLQRWIGVMHTHERGWWRAKHIWRLAFYLPETRRVWMQAAGPCIGRTDCHICMMDLLKRVVCRHLHLTD